MDKYWIPLPCLQTLIISPHLDPLMGFCIGSISSLNFSFPVFLVFPAPISPYWILLHILYQLPCFIQLFEFIQKFVSSLISQSIVTIILSNSLSVISSYSFSFQVITMGLTWFGGVMSCKFFQVFCGFVLGLVYWDKVISWFILIILILLVEIFATFKKN